MSTSAPDDQTRSLTTPVFAEKRPTPDPTTFEVKHPSDGPFYQEIDALNKKHKLQAIKFPAPAGGPEPRLSLSEVLGKDSKTGINWITKNKQIVFHSLGDCGSTRSPRTEDLVTDKLVADFQEQDDHEIPQFNLLLGDIVYSFGELQYYYDQFYDPYRDYPAPILAAAGNHDSLVPPGLREKALEGFLRNFCADKAKPFQVMPEAGGLSRTAQIQPGVFFTFDAPFVCILVLFSNCLEDPGVIADDHIGESQITFLETALGRLKKENYSGALLFAHHHPPYTLARHGWSIKMQQQIDEVCHKVGLWPHVDLAGHAHNYQRFTRYRADGTEIPYIVCGNGGHNVQKLKKVPGPDGDTALRTPQVIYKKDDERIVFESYDDTNYGYLRIIATEQQLRVEYHPASDGTAAKTPDDVVTVSLKDRKLTHFKAADLGFTERAAHFHKLRAEQRH